MQTARSTIETRAGETSAAGPLSDLALAVVAALVFAGFRKAGALHEQGSLAGPLALVVVYLVIINVTLMLFNLIPIPPLDGSHVFYYLLPASLGAAYRRVGWRGMLVLMGLLFFVPSRRYSAQKRVLR